MFTVFPLNTSRLKCILGGHGHCLIVPYIATLSMSVVTLFIRLKVKKHSAPKTTECGRLTDDQSSFMKQCQWTATACYGNSAIMFSECMCLPNLPEEKSLGWQWQYMSWVMQLSTWNQGGYNHEGMPNCFIMTRRYTKAMKQCKHSTDEE